MERPYAREGRILYEPGGVVCALHTHNSMNTAAVRLQLPAVANICATILCLGALQLWLNSSPLYPAGTDPYYHIKVSQIYAERGMIDSFPWAHFSILKDNFGDKEVLFHWGMIPFLKIFSDPFRGALFYGAVLGTISLCVFALVLHASGARWPILWILLALSCGPFFLYRLSTVRPQLCGITFALLTFYALLRDSRWGLFITCLFYPLFYCAPHVAIILSVAFALMRGIGERRIVWKPVVIALSGMSLGFLLHPHCPHILKVWYVQNFGVLYHAIADTPGISLAGELEPPVAEVFIKNCGLLFFACFLAVLVVFQRGIRLPDNAVAAFIIASAFTALTCFSKRFAEYSIPFVTIFVAQTYTVVATNLKAALPRMTPIAVAAILMVSAALAVAGIHKTRLMVEAGAPTLKNAAIWLSEHSNPGDIVFTSDWDESPELFYYNAINYYMVILDPTFMKAYDERLYTIWAELCSGVRRDLVDHMARTFHARFALVARTFKPLLRTAYSDSRLVEVYADTSCVIFQLQRGVIPAPTTGK